MKAFYALVIMSCLFVACNQQQYTKNEASNQNFEKQVEKLLGKMTLKEKIDQLGGIGFDTKSNDSLGIPTLRMTDGPVGVRWKESTALPAAVALASTWDRELIYEVGEMLGREVKAKDRNFLLAPCVNIHRFPVGGRNFESYGEDPYLAGQIAIPFIQGVQNEKVLACAKHFACNNQEWHRSSVNAVVDERALHEIYLPAFKAAVQEAGVWTVMSSYNKVNGKWTAENDYLLTTVLKDKWGFRGFVVSDWGGSHSTAGSAIAGLDLEMPFGHFYTDSLITLAIKNNEISENVIDEKVRRLLRVRFEAGMFDEQKKVSEDVIKSEEHKTIAYEAAVKGIVLLKNENNLLPVNVNKHKKIAVIGPNAAFPRVGGGGSSKITPLYAVSPLEGLKNKAGENFEINYAFGTVIKEDIRIIENAFYEEIDGSKGLTAEYYDNINLEGEPSFVRHDNEINFLWYYDAPRWELHGDDDGNYFSVRWTGKIKAPKLGTYKFYVMHNDGARLKINNKSLIDTWDTHRKHSRIAEAEITLTRDQVYDVVMEYYNNGSVSEAKLGWEIPGIDLIQEAVDLAKTTDIAIIFAGLSDHFEGEGRDREFLILENQDKLINEIVAVNPNTIVVMISGTPPVMEAWADKVPAIVQAWFGGQEGGNAIADVLLGNRNPSGKLPCSFYRSADDSPGFEDYKNKDLQSHYKEGIYVGYRYLDKHGMEARFPFGHGLSYTGFSYGTPSYTSPEKNHIEVKFTLTNTGDKAGAEVVQIYVKPVSTGAERPEKELKAFEKVKLEPDESREITILLDEDDFKYYDVTSHDWQVDKGEYQILIGSSSKDIRQVVEGLQIQ